LSSKLGLALAVAASAAGANSLGVVLEIPWLCWGAVVLWLWAQTLRPGAVTALFFSAVFCVSHFWWIGDAAQAYWNIPKWISWPALAVTAAFFEPQFLLYALARHRFARLPVARVAAPVALYFTVEQFWPKPLGDTWAFALFPDAVVRQSAALLGTQGLTALMLLNAEWVLAILKSSSRRMMLLSSLAVMHGALQCQGRAPRSEADTREVRVMAVQGAIEPYGQLIEREGVNALMEAVVSRYESLTRDQLNKGAVDLIVFPETMYPTTLGQLKSEAQQVFDERLLELSKVARAPLLLGTYARDDVQEYNVAALVWQNEVLDRYRKVRLFPFSEAIPFGEQLQKLGWWSGPLGWGRGDGPKLLTLPNAPYLQLQPFICYESLTPAFSNDPNASLLVNLTNDDWFHSATQAKLHLWISAFRSIEANRPQVRVTNGGLSAAIDPRGNVSDTIQVGEAQARTWVLQVPVTLEAPRLPQTLQILTVLAVFIVLGSAFVLYRRPAKAPIEVVSIPPTVA
jgi:apolipoprotein N-acyltransferase